MSCIILFPSLGMEMIISLHVSLLVPSYDTLFRKYVLRSPVIYVDFRQDFETHDAAICAVSIGTSM